MMGILENKYKGTDLFKELIAESFPNLERGVQIHRCKDIPKRLSTTGINEGVYN